jgi:hypothetical protein
MVPPWGAWCSRWCGDRWRGDRCCLDGLSSNLPCPAALSCAQASPAALSCAQASPAALSCAQASPAALKPAPLRTSQPRCAQASPAALKPARCAQASPATARRHPPWVHERIQTSQTSRSGYHPPCCTVATGVAWMGSHRTLPCPAALRGAQASSSQPVALKPARCAQATHPGSMSESRPARPVVTSLYQLYQFLLSTRISSGPGRLSYSSNHPPFDERIKATTASNEVRSLLYLPLWGQAAAIGSRPPPPESTALCAASYPWPGPLALANPVCQSVNVSVCQSDDVRRPTGVKASAGRPVWAREPHSSMVW